MKNTVRIIIVLVLSLNICFGQKKSDPQPEDTILAKELKEKYEDDNIALISSKDEVEFVYNKKYNRYSAIHSQRERLMNISARSEIYYYSFYSAASSRIDIFDIFYRHGKKVRFKVEDEAFNSSGIFHGDLRVKSVNLKFPLQGYTFSTFVEKKYKDLKYLTSMYFSSLYPTLKKELKFKIPHNLDVELKEINFEGFNIELKISEEKNHKIYTYTLKDINAQFDEDKSPGPSYIYPHILILAKSFERNGEKHQLFETTQDLYNWYHSLVKSLNNDNSIFKDKVKELTENAKNDDEKIKNIYYWVQDNIRYIAFEDGIAGFKPDEASTVYKNKYGDCKGMANLTKQMLKEAGFDARLTWIGTKRIAYDYSTPNLSVDNHMICSLLKDGQTLFLDGTEKYGAYGEYANRIQGKQVLIEDGDGFLLEMVPVAKNDFNKKEVFYSLNISNENLIGHVKNTFYGESRASFLYYFNNMKNDEKEAFLNSYTTDGNSNIQTSNIETSDLTNREIDVEITYDIDVKNVISSFDGTVYIDMNLTKELKELDLRKRKTDYVFRYSQYANTIVELTIPNGYTFTELPESVVFEMENYSINLSYSKEGDKIICRKILQIKDGIIKKEDFKMWNTLLKELKKFYSEQVILNLN